MTTEKKNTAPKTKPLPEEPELLRLWRELVARRDELVAEIRRWESAEHPIAAYRAKVAAKHGEYGHSKDRIRRDETEAQKIASRRRRELTALDSAVTSGTRDKANGKRSLGIEQLKALLAKPEIAELEERARTALEAWWDDRDNRGKRHSARVALYGLTLGKNAVPSDFSALPDLDGVLKEDRAYCREVARLRPKPSSTMAAVISRVIRRARGERVA